MLIRFALTVAVSLVVFVGVWTMFLAYFDAEVGFFGGGFVGSIASAMTGFVLLAR